MDEVLGFHRVVHALFPHQIGARLELGSLVYRVAAGKIRKDPAAFVLSAEPPGRGCMAKQKVVESEDSRPPGQNNEATLGLMKLFRRIIRSRAQGGMNAVLEELRQEEPHIGSGSRQDSTPSPEHS